MDKFFSKFIEIYSRYQFEPKEIENGHIYTSRKRAQFLTHSCSPVKIKKSGKSAVLTPLLPDVVSQLPLPVSSVDAE